MPTTFVVRTPAYRKEGNMCKGNLSRVSLARSVTRPQATGFALQNRTNTKKDTLLRVFFRVVIVHRFCCLGISIFCSLLPFLSFRTLLFKISFYWQAIEKGLKLTIFGMCQ